MGSVLARTVRSELATWLVATFAIFVTRAAFLVSWDLKESRAPPVVIVDSSLQAELVRDIAVVNSFAGVAYVPAAVCTGVPPQSALYAPIGESSADFLQMTRAVIMPLAFGEKVSSLGLVQSVLPEFSGGDTAASAAMRPSPVLSTQGILPIAS